jgi:hypothetical protein
LSIKVIDVDMSHGDTIISIIWCTNGNLTPICQHGNIPARVVTSCFSIDVFSGLSPGGSIKVEDVNVS